MEFRRPPQLPLFPAEAVTLGPMRWWPGCSRTKA